MLNLQVRDILHNVIQGQGHRALAIAFLGCATICVLCRKYVPIEMHIIASFFTKYFFKSLTTYLHHGKSTGTNQWYNLLKCIKILAYQNLRWSKYDPHFLNFLKVSKFPSVQPSMSPLHFIPMRNSNARIKKSITKKNPNVGK